MLQLFRNFFKSKLGVGITLALLVLLALAFVSGDALSNFTGAVSGGDKVAVVGDDRIDTAELDTRAREALSQMQREDPTATMASFIASDGLTDTLEGLISRRTLQQVAAMFGLRTGQRLVDSEIAKDPNMRGPDGNFSQDTFRQALAQMGRTEEDYRDDINIRLLAQTMLSPVQAVPQMPASIARRYSELGLETRSGDFAVLPAAAYALTGAPTDAQLSAFYAENRDRYIRPERRVIRYAVFGEDAFGNLPDPTEVQISARYTRDRALYAARETRTFTQLVATTRAAAQAIVDEVNRGTTLEASARAKGLSTTSIAATTKDDLATATSAPVANAGFAAERGALAAPAQGPIGWYIVRVDEVARQPARTLAQVRGEIATALTTEQRREALNEATARIDDEFSDGKSLSDVARELNLTLSTTRPLTAAGLVYGTQEPAPAELTRLLPTAFEMEESEPQLAETVPGEQFIVFDVSQVTRSAAAPLVQIRNQVVTAWRQDEGMKRASAASARVLERVAGGSSLRDAVAAETASLPAVSSVSLSRQEIERSPQVTRPVILFFSMAKGTTKALEVPEIGAYYLVHLADVRSQAVAADNPRVAAQRGQLAQLLPDEYSQQFIASLRREVDVEVDDDAVTALANLLGGSAN
ncbi:MAG: SurA N-terminal domain-containing protein [Alteraurantiacibacter sp.]